MMKKITSICFLSLVTVAGIFAADTLSLDNYLEVISKNYPLIKKANLYDDFTEAYGLKAKGVFDPKVTSEFSSKNFGGTNYFRVWQTELKLPTTLPVDFSLGHERNDGDFLDSQNSVPQQGLIYGAINLSLIRGFMFDDQRYNVLQADLNAIKGQIERRALTREILYEAVLAYIDWSVSYYKNEILKEYLVNVTERHKNVVGLFRNGDKPAIDTIESRFSLNTARKYNIESTQELTTKRQKVELFIWDQNGNPLIMASSVVPLKTDQLLSRIRGFNKAEILDFDIDPLVQKVDNEITYLENQNKLEKENLKPQLNLKYNTIINLGKEDFVPSFSVNDYKYGVSVSIPILNRKTRGEILLNDIEIEQNINTKKQYKQKILNRYDNLQINETLQEDVVSVAIQKIEYGELLNEAEVLKFEIGESSFFMVNQRQQKLLMAQIELMESYHKLGKTITELYYYRMGQQL